jgi:Flp pilus assembly protein TadD
MLYEIRSLGFYLLIAAVLAADAAAQNSQRSTAPAGNPDSVVSRIVKRNIRNVPSTSLTADSRKQSITAETLATELNNQAAAYARSGQYEKALVELRRATEIHPDSTDILINLSVVLDHLKRWDESREVARQAVEISPDDVRARSQLCELSLATGRNQEAVTCYSRLEKKLGHLDHDAMSKYALALARTNQADIARKYLEEVVRANTYNVAAANALGVIYFNEENYKEAAAVFKRASEADPRRAEVRYNLGITQLRLGNKPGAISQYKMLRELSPEKAQQLYRIIYQDKLVFVGDN